MGKLSKANFECPKGSGGIHRWLRQKNGAAWCENCDVQLTPAEAEDVFRGSEPDAAEAVDL